MQQPAETSRLQNVCGNDYASPAPAIQHHILVLVRADLNKTGIKPIMGYIYCAWYMPFFIFFRITHVQDEICMASFDALHQFGLRNICHFCEAGVAHHQKKQLGVGEAEHHSFAEKAYRSTWQAGATNGNVRFYKISHSHPCQHKKGARPEIVKGKTDMKKYAHNSRRGLVWTEGSDSL